MSLNDVAATSLRYANEVADRILADPTDDPHDVKDSDYSVNHHLVSASPDDEHRFIQMMVSAMSVDNVTAAVHAGIFKHKNVDDDNGYDPNQPRDAHGQWTRVGTTALAERIANAVHGAAALKSPTLTLTSEDDPNHPALATYASHQYTLINNALRYAKTSDKGVSGLKPDLRNVINEIDDEMSRSTLKDDIVVYRGIKTPENAFGATWNDQPGSMVGVEYRDPHYSSTSASANIAMDFSEIIRSKYEQDRKGRISGVKRTRTSGVQLRILAPKGSHAVGLALHGEGEVLLPRDTHFRIVGDHVVDGDRLLDVEVVSG